MINNYVLLQSFGLEDLVSLGEILSFSNLSYRGVGRSGSGSSSHHHSVAPWPTANLTDLTVVSQNPKDMRHKKALAKLKQQLPVSS